MVDNNTPKLAQLAEIFRSSRGPDYELANIYLNASTKTLLLDIKLDEGMFGEQIWMACEALRIRGEETDLSKWLLSDRKLPCPVLGATKTSAPRI
jgi:hypothetical protein